MCDLYIVRASQGEALPYPFWSLQQDAANRTHRAQAAGSLPLHPPCSWAGLMVLVPGHLHRRLTMKSMEISIPPL